MATISKTLAGELAGKLIQKKQVDLKKAKQDFVSKIIDMNNKTLPKKVVEALHQYPHFFNLKTYSRLKLGEKSFSVHSKTPFLPNNKEETIQLDLSEKEISEIIETFEGLDKKEMVLNELVSELIQIFIKLKTIENINKKFPETLDFINISDYEKVKEKLKV